MDRRISQITQRLMVLLTNGDPHNKALLAGLRVADEITSPQARIAWPVLIGQLDDNMLSQDGRPTYAENAIFTALHLFALHQQGLEESVAGNAHDGEAIRFFAALAQLRQNADDRVATDRRVEQLLGMTSFEGIRNALTRAEAILKASKGGIKVDYAALAADLYAFQFSYEAANRVLLRWGQDYYRVNIQAEAERIKQS